jgi:hypothetical protein
MLTKKFHGLIYEISLFVDNEISTLTIIWGYTESVWLSIMFGEASQIERVTGFAKLNTAIKAKKRRLQERRSKGGSLMLSSILSFSKQLEKLSAGKIKSRESQ